MKRNLTLNSRVNPKNVRRANSGLQYGFNLDDPYQLQPKQKGLKRGRSKDYKAEIFKILAQDKPDEESIIASITAKLGDTYKGVTEAAKSAANAIAETAKTATKAVKKRVFGDERDKIEQLIDGLRDDVAKFQLETDTSSDNIRAQTDIKVLQDMYLDDAIFHDQEKIEKFKKRLEEIKRLNLTEDDKQRLTTIELGIQVFQRDLDMVEQDVNDQIEALEVIEAIQQPTKLHVKQNTQAVPTSLTSPNVEQEGGLKEVPVEPFGLTKEQQEQKQKEEEEKKRKQEEEEKKQKEEEKEKKRKQEEEKEKKRKQEEEEKKRKEEEQKQKKEKKRKEEEKKQEEEQKQEEEEKKRKEEEQKQKIIHDLETTGGDLSRKINSVIQKIQEDIDIYQGLQTSYETHMKKIKDLKKAWMQEYVRWNVTPHIGYFTKIENLSAEKFKETVVDTLVSYLDEVNEDRKKMYKLNARFKIIPSKEIAHIHDLVNQMYVNLNQIEINKQKIQDLKKSIKTEIKFQIQIYEKNKEREKNFITSSYFKYPLYKNMVEMTDNVEQFDNNSADGIYYIVEEFLERNKEHLTTHHSVEFRNFCKSFILLWSYKTIITNLKQLFETTFPDEKL